MSIDSIINPGYALEQERKRLDAQIAYIDILLANMKPMGPPKPCPACNGTGLRWVHHAAIAGPCKSCKGGAP